MDRGIIDEAEGVVIDTLYRFVDGEVNNGFWEDGDIDFCGISALTLVVVDVEGYGIGACLCEGMLWFELVIDGRAITEVPGEGIVSGSGIGGEVFEGEQIVVEALRGIVNREFGFG